MSTLFTAAKGIGMLLVLICTTGFGFTMAGSLLQRVRALETALALMDALEAELSFRLSPPGQAVRDLAQRGTFAHAKYLSECALRCDQGQPFPKAWYESVMQTSSALLPEEKKILAGLSDIVGQSDLEGQKAALAHVRLTLNARLGEAREIQHGQGRLYKTLGLLLGCAIVIVGC